LAQPHLKFLRVCLFDGLCRSNRQPACVTAGSGFRYAQPLSSHLVVTYHSSFCIYLYYASYSSYGCLGG
jgi:hypothetical protein